MKRIFLIATLVSLTAACDSADVTGGGDSLVISGRVTDDSGYGKTSGSVDGAVVTAASIDVDGSVRTLSGSAEADASGRYTLEVESDASMFLVTAAKAEFESKAMAIRGTSNADVDVAPMKTESHAEAEVYIASRNSAAFRSLSLAQIAAFVDADVASEFAAGTSSASEIAGVIARGEQSEDDYVQEEQPDREEQMIREKKEREESALVTLQSQLAAAASSSAEAVALDTFEAAMLTALVDAGADASTNAKAKSSKRSAIEHFSSSAELSANARFELRKRAEIDAAVATSAAVEAAFAANGAAQASIDELEAAAAQMESAMVSANSETEIDAAYAGFTAAVDARLAVELGVSSQAITLARTAFAAARSALDASVNVAASSAQIANAHFVFYTEAEAAAATSLSGNAKADMASEVLSMVAVR